MGEMSELPQYEQIEKAFKVPAEIIERLPSSTETRRAGELLKQAEAYTREARERVKYQPVEDVGS